MPGPCIHRLTSIRAWSLLCVFLLGSWLRPGLAETPSLWQEEEQRLRVGLKIFPAVLGALEALESKRSADGSLLVLVVHQGPTQIGHEAALNLGGIGQVRGLPLSVKELTVNALDHHDTTPIAGIFVASPGLGADRLGAWSEHYRTLVFSPFAGEVEVGAVAGVYVTDRILPYINRPAAQRAGLHFRPFFLKVARQYE